MSDTDRSYEASKFSPFKWLTKRFFDSIEWSKYAELRATDESNTTQETGSVGTKENTNAVPNDRKSKMKTGWERVKAMYTDDVVHAEREVTTFLTRTAFMTGAFIGGFFGVNRTIERYEMYSQGKKFLSYSDVVLRKWDYAIVVFMKNGFKAGLKSAVLVGGITLLASHLAVWRNHFSAWYFPSISTPVFAIMSLPYGSHALVEGTIIGLTTGLVLTVATYLVAYAEKKSVDDTYKELRSEYEAKLGVRKKRRSQIKAIMREQKLWFPGDAAKILREREAIGSLRDIEDESNVEIKKSL